MRPIPNTLFYVTNYMVISPARRPSSGPVLGGFQNPRPTPPKINRKNQRALLTATIVGIAGSTVAPAAAATTPGGRRIATAKLLLLLVLLAA